MPETLLQKPLAALTPQGIWDWKDVYDIQEAAFSFMLPFFGEHLKAQSRSAIGALQEFARLQALGLTETRRSEQAIALQQFSTPLQMAYVASKCGHITPSDIVLEPSAGTGILAQFCAIRGAEVVLNELSDRRRELLKLVFPQASVYPFDAEHIHDHLPEGIHPSVVVMNPPFSASPKIDRRNPKATGNHVRSAFLRLMPGGRMVLISADWFKPESKHFQSAFEGLENQVCVRASVTFAGDAYIKHGTSTPTRLSVIDKIAPEGTPLSFNIGTESMIAQIQGKSEKVRSLELAKVAHLLKHLPSRSKLQPVAAKPKAKTKTAKAKQSKATPQTPQIFRPLLG